MHKMRYFFSEKVQKLPALEASHLDSLASGGGPPASSTFPSIENTWLRHWLSALL